MASNLTVTFLYRPIPRSRRWRYLCRCRRCQACRFYEQTIHYPILNRGIRNALWASVYQANNSLKVKDIAVTVTGLSYGSLFAKRCGNMIIVNIVGGGVKSGVNPWEWSSAIGKLPASCAPKRFIYGTVATDTNVSDLVVNTSGEIFLFAKSGKIESGHNVDGQVCYFIE